MMVCTRWMRSSLRAKFSPRGEGTVQRASEVEEGCADCLLCGRGKSSYSEGTSHLAQKQMGDLRKGKSLWLVLRWDCADIGDTSSFRSDLLRLGL